MSVMIISGQNPLMPALIGKIENACADSGAKQAKSPAEGKVAKELFHDDFLFLDD